MAADFEKTLRENMCKYLAVQRVTGRLRSWVVAKHTSRAALLTPRTKSLLCSSQPSQRSSSVKPTYISAASHSRPGFCPRMCT